MRAACIHRLYYKCASWWATWGNLCSHQLVPWGWLATTSPSYFSTPRRQHCALEKTTSQEKLRALFVSTTQRVALKKCVRLNLRSTARISEHYYAHPPSSRRARLLHFFECSSSPTQVISSSLCRVYRTCEVSASNLRQFPFYDVISETSLLLAGFALARTENRDVLIRQR